jgi:lysophospholipase L1-like esterase
MPTKSKPCAISNFLKLRDPSLIGVATACLVAAFASTAARADDPKSPLAKPTLATGDMVVFLGDSITQQCLYTQYVEDYLVTRLPRTQLKFHNSGVGGDKAADALARFERDVAAYKPKYVTVLLGMNDGSYQPYEPMIFEAYRSGMRTLIDKIVAIGATPILITPTMYDARAARARPAKFDPMRAEYYNSTLAYYGAWLREIAVENGYGFADMYGPLNSLTLATRKKDPKFTLIADAVHPGAGGQAVMAGALIADLGLPTRVATLSLSSDDDGDAKVLAQGGKVSDAKFTSDGLEFTFLADSLPWVLPDDAKEGYDLAHFGHRLSRDALEVHGLKPGKYQLLVDDQPIGIFSSQDLEDTVELQGKTTLPQVEQAAAVAKLNQQRNQEAVLPLRMLWRSKKLLGRAQQQLEQKPDDKKVQAEVARLEKELADFDGQIASLEASATKLLDEMYTTAQPKPHRYRLVRQ